MAARGGALLKYLRVHVTAVPQSRSPCSRSNLFSLSFNAIRRRFSEEVRGSFLDKSEVTDRVVNVVKNFQKVEPSKLLLFLFTYGSCLASMLGRVTGSAMVFYLLQIWDLYASALFLFIGKEEEEEMDVNSFISISERRRFFKNSMVLDPSEVIGDKVLEFHMSSWAASLSLVHDGKRNQKNKCIDWGTGAVTPDR
ncbi:acyl carrier protein 2 mitochondrial-like [Tripterygium wilfordii]|uniref:Acyl carrier protein 2 mitochondrial-like n=1 Tax=Tripterygium wilfordii TaxID=458696 RepID=A0A7J7D5D6_TRIWF|nr:acyl carrier protein 2 mitochondrial-like [Tripterygium wilfordii]